MQESSTPQLSSHASFRMFTFLGIFLLLFCYRAGFSQTAEAAPLPITTDAYPKDGWKSPADYSAVLHSEQQQTAQKLADPNLIEEEFALFTGYAQMLSLMQDDLDAHQDIEKIAFNNYDKIVKAAPGDPVLKH